LIRQWEEICLACLKFHDYDLSNYLDRITFVFDMGSGLKLFAKTLLACFVIACWFHMKQAVDGNTKQGRKYRALFLQHSKDHPNGLTHKTFVGYVNKIHNLVHKTVAAHAKELLDSILDDIPEVM